MYLLLQPKKQELKITGSLWQPPVLASPTPPSGTAAAPQAPPGTFWEHFLLLLLTLGVGVGVSSKSLPSEKV